MADSALTAALAYAAMTWPVAPLHSVRAGVCSCAMGAACDRSPGKHPRTEHGLDDATTDVGVIRSWWQRWHDANIAVRCDRLFVLDVDPRHGGDQYLRDLEIQHGELPATKRILTGGGGWHWYFAAPSRKWRKQIAPGIDVQAGRGKYVLAPPSNHLSGRLYQVDLEAPIAAAPPWLIEAATAPATPPAPVGRPVTCDSLIERRVRAYLGRCPPAVSGQGGHAHTFLTAQHVVRGFALDDGTAYTFLSEWNARCEPPWSEDDLRRKIREARAKGSRVEWGAHLNDDRSPYGAIPAGRSRSAEPPHRDEDAPPPQSRMLHLVPRDRVPGEDDEDPAGDSPADPQPQASVVEREWRPLDPAYLTVQPPARRWLLRHPTRDGEEAAPNEGDGLLPLGKVAILASEGGTGKTNVVLALAVAIACARRWLSHFDVDWEARRGRVFLGLAEEDADEVHRRLYSTAEHFRLTADERRRVTEQVVIVPLAGFPVALVGYGPDGRTLSSTPELLGLRQRLHAEAGRHGWSLVCLDPLARWAGADVEGDTPAATRFVQALETLTSVPGKPTVLVPHHSSKTSRRMGSVDARGVTAITDASRWTGTLRTEGKLVYFIQSKSNYSKPMFDELKLLRAEGGFLYAASPEDLEAMQAAKEQREEQRGLSKEDRQEARIAVLEVKLLTALDVAKRGSITSQGLLLGLVKGDTNLKKAALGRLLGDERIVKEGGAYAVPKKVV